MDMESKVNIVHNEGFLFVTISVSGRQSANASADASAETSSLLAKLIELVIDFFKLGGS